MKCKNLDFTPALSINEFMDGIQEITEKSGKEILGELFEQNMYPSGDPFLFSHDKTPGWIFEAINEIINISGAKRIIVYE